MLYSSSPWAGTAPANSQPAIAVPSGASGARAGRSPPGAASASMRRKASYWMIGVSEPASSRAARSKVMRTERP